MIRCPKHQVQYTDFCPECSRETRLAAPAPSGVVWVAAEPDLVNHPPHYTSHPSGVECIQITEHMGFNLGNAMKYIWRADLKTDAVEDLRKARWYIDREIAKRIK